MRIRTVLCATLLSTVLVAPSTPLFAEKEGRNADDVIKAITQNTVLITVFDIGDNTKILRGKGTGVILSCDVSDPSRPKSLILTNWHVSFGRTQIDIIFPDGTYNTAAEAISSDKKTDSAVLFVPYAHKNCTHVHYKMPVILDPIIVGGFRWVRRDGFDEAILFFLEGGISTSPMNDGFVGVSAPVTIGSSGSGVWATEKSRIYLVGIMSSMGGRNILGTLCEVLRRAFDKDICGKQFFEPILSPGGGIMVPLSLIHQDILKRIDAVHNCSRCEDIKKLLSIMDTHKH